MYSEKKLNDFAKLTLSIGVNLQKGQGLEILCPVELKDVAHIFTEVAFDMGASKVNIRWNDEIIDKLNYENASTDILKDIPKWFVESKNYLVKKGWCYVAIDADNPSLFKDIPAEKLMAVASSRSKALKKFSECVMSNGIRWCVVSIPTLDWAKQVFPNEQEPLKKLENEIAKTMRLDYDNPTLEWKKHIETLEKRAEYLNKMNFEYLEYSNIKGTNIKVGLALNHVWLSAKEIAKDGVPFVANMPTEEVFTCPHKDKIFGTVYSALPLSFNGQIVDDFSITFDKGKIVDFTAKKGYDILKKLIETDKGTHSIGEVALIGKNSPIAKSKILYYNTLFDENASCHLALGKAYPTTVKNGANLSKKELSNLGVNDSVEHVDFMVGTDDLNIVGITFDGKKIPLFKDGEWCI